MNLEKVSKNLVAGLVVSTLAIASNSASSQSYLPVQINNETINILEDGGVRSLIIKKDNGETETFVDENYDRRVDYIVVVNGEISDVFDNPFQLAWAQAKYDKYIFNYWKKINKEIKEIKSQRK